MANNQGPGPMPSVLRRAPINGPPKRTPDVPAPQTREYTPPPKPVPVEKPIPVGCSFTKPCKLPDGSINYVSPSGAIPTDAVKEYGEFALLGGRQTDSQGNIPLKKISGNALPTALGTLLLGGSALASASALCGGLCTAGSVVTAGVGTAATGAGTIVSLEVV